MNERIEKQNVKKQKYLHKYKNIITVDKINVNQIYNHNHKNR
jgi:hypothetical protein